MDANAYYLINKNTNGLYDCMQSYKDLEAAKQQAKEISTQLNITILIVKPVVKVIPNIECIIKDLN